MRPVNINQIFFVVFSAVSITLSRRVVANQTGKNTKHSANDCVIESTQNEGCVM